MNEIRLEREEVLLYVFRCLKCKKAFVRTNGNDLCDVKHTPGQCCHINNVQIDDENVIELAMNILNPYKRV